MSSIQDKLLAATKGITRKLWDNEMSNKGTEINCLRLRISIDKYDDAETVTILQQNDITMYINFPDVVPLTRYRPTTGSTTPVTKTNMYFFEVLPIEIYTKWVDNVEIGDFIIFNFNDEKDNKLEMIIQIVDVLGIPAKYLIWKQSVAAPYTGELTSTIQDAIDNWEPV